jgi:DNA-directed RNA polymerase subunit RPC12/RpoP
MKIKNVETKQTNHQFTSGMNFSYSGANRLLGDKKKCVICGKEFSGYGNNPWPVKSRGKCCDECNLNIVIPARLKMVKK